MGQHEAQLCYRDRIDGDPDTSGYDDDDIWLSVIGVRTQRRDIWIVLVHTHTHTERDKRARTHTHIRRGGQSFRQIGKEIE